MARPDADNARAGAVGRRAHARSHGRLVGGPPAPHDPSGAAAQHLSLLRALCGRLVAADVQAQEGDAGADFWFGAFPAELGGGRKEMFCCVMYRASTTGSSTGAAASAVRGRYVVFATSAGASEWAG